MHFVEPDGRIIPFDTYNTFYLRSGFRAALKKRAGTAMSVPPEVPKTADDSMNRLFGLILMTAGGLMATLCGLCSGGVFVLIALQLSSSDSACYLC